MTVQELIDGLMKVNIEVIIGVITFLWFFCMLLSCIIYADKKDVHWSVIALFPANLIYVLKTFWRSIIKAIKS